ncbi:MAG: protein kinase [Propionibacteriales bacterium]|nr:protein kinase [Propionibacteriales bacterium]
MTEQIGEHIGRYPVRGVIGSGGFGTVYLAIDPRTSEQVAIKVLDWPDEGWRRQMFRDEVAALLSVNHPNVVRVRDVIDVPGLAALVTDFVEGASLREVLVRNGPLDGPQSLSVLWGALSGLSAVHAVGLVHADLKPENILLDRTGASRLIDFGLTSPPRTLDGPDTWIGTPAYIAPEVVLGTHIDQRSDIYAAAIILFELLCGRAPYVGPNPVMTALLHVQSDVPDARLLNPAISEALAGLCTQDLAKNPKERHQNTAAFLASLDHAATESYGARWAAAGAGLGAMVSAALAGLSGGAVAGLGLLGAAPVAAGGAAALGVGGGIAGAGAGVIGLSGTAGGGAAAGGAGGATAGSGAMAALGGAKVAVAAASVLAVVAAGTVAALVLRGGEEPDTTAPVVVSADTGPRIAYWANGGEIHTVRPDGSDDISVGGSGIPHWSPDGRHIAFNRGDGVYVMDADGSNPTRLTPASIANTSPPVWSPDGLTLAFGVSDSEGDAVGVSTIGVDGSGLRQVAAGASSPQWAANNSLLVLTELSTEDSSLPWQTVSLVSRDGTGKRRLFDARPGELQGSDWFAVSPDGTQVAYFGDRTEDGQGHEVRTISTTGAGGRTVGRVDNRSSEIVWSPDGTHLGVVAVDLNNYDVRKDDDTYLSIMALDDGTQVRVDNDLMEAELAWSPDGTRVAFRGGHEVFAGDDATSIVIDGIYTVAVDGTDQQQVVSGDVQAPSWRAAVQDVPAAPPRTTPTTPAGPTVFEPPAEIDGTGDVRALNNLPQDFQDFIGELARGKYAGDEFPDQTGETGTWVEVAVYDPRGYASGYARGLPAYWTRSDGGWSETSNSDGVPLCSTFEGSPWPASVFPQGGLTCGNADGTTRQLPGSP